MLQKRPSRVKVHPLIRLTVVINHAAMQGIGWKNHEIPRTHGKGFIFQNDARVSADEKIQFEKLMRMKRCRRPDGRAPVICLEILLFSHFPIIIRNPFAFHSTTPFRFIRFSFFFAPKKVYGFVHLHNNRETIAATVFLFSVRHHKYIATFAIFQACYAIAFTKIIDYYSIILCAQHPAIKAII